MRRFVTIITIIASFILLISSANAAASIKLSKTKAEAGDSVTISGTAQMDSSIIIKITDENGNILFFDAVKTNASGGYSVLFVVPGDITSKKLTVTAGSGTDVATAGITIVYSTVPTSRTNGHSGTNGHSSRTHSHSRTSRIANHCADGSSLGADGVCYRNKQSGKDGNARYHRARRAGRNGNNEHQC